MNDALERTFGFVTRHNVMVLLVMLLLTAGVVTGASQLQLESDSNASDAAGDTEVAQKMAYVQNAYESTNDSGENTQPAVVYVRGEDNALSKEALLESLRFQKTVRDNESVAGGLGDRRVIGVANLVAIRAANDPSATLDEQIAALEGASESEVEQLVTTTLSEDSRALQLMPKDYERGTATAESHRMVF